MFKELRDAVFNSEEYKNSLTALPNFEDRVIDPDEPTRDDIDSNIAMYKKLMVQMTATVEGARTKGWPDQNIFLELAFAAMTESQKVSVAIDDDYSAEGALSIAAQAIAAAALIITELLADN